MWGGAYKQKAPDARGLDDSGGQRFPFKEVQRGLGLERFRFTPFRDVQRGLNKKHPDARGGGVTVGDSQRRPGLRAQRLSTLIQFLRIFF